MLAGEIAYRRGEYDAAFAHLRAAVAREDALPYDEPWGWLQARRLPVPGYRISATRGQAHAQTFEVECEVPALSLKHLGEGRSRRLAEQEAARRMLDALKANDQPGSPLRS